MPFNALLPDENMLSSRTAGSTTSDIKDISDLLALAFAGVESYEPKEDLKLISFVGDLTVTMPAESNNKIVSNTPLLLAEFLELLNRIFDKFKHAAVVAYRGKQWIQLQNVAKLMFNCMSSLMVNLPAMTNQQNKKVFCVQDLWIAISPFIYIVAENLLDMLIQTTPIDVSLIEIFIF